jgi:6-pyruvoyltetrahydropterin/6-carboxytetrahydropterin synthase
MPASARVSVTRRVGFSASHFCRVPGLSDQENLALYGPASRPHGHNYQVEVTVSGPVDPVHGMVLDLKELKAILDRQVVEPFDHRFLNHEAPPFDRMVPTAENIAREVWRRLAAELNRDGLRLERVRLYETADLWVDYAE